MEAEYPNVGFPLRCGAEQQQLHSKSFFALLRPCQLLGLFALLKPRRKIESALKLLYYARDIGCFIDSRKPIAKMVRQERVTCSRDLIRQLIVHGPKVRKICIHHDLAINCECLHTGGALRTKTSSY